MSGFDIKAEVRAALAASGEADPEIVAAEVLASIPAKHLRAALAAVLPHYVSSVVSMERANGWSRRPPHKGKGEPPSRRRAAAVSIFMDRLFAGEKWKHLGDCTADDLMGAAAQRRLAAAGLERNAAALEALADLVRKRKASKVADLPPELVRSTLEGIAA